MKPLQLLLCPPPRGRVLGWLNVAEGPLPRAGRSTVRRSTVRRPAEKSRCQACHGGWTQKRVKKKRMGGREREGGRDEGKGGGKEGGRELLFSLKKMK